MSFIKKIPSAKVELPKWTIFWGETHLTLQIRNSAVDAPAGGELRGGALVASGRQLEAEDGLFMPEPDRASLHDSEGLLHVQKSGFPSPTSTHFVVL